MGRFCLVVSYLNATKRCAIRPIIARRTGVRKRPLRARFPAFSGVGNRRRRSPTGTLNPSRNRISNLSGRAARQSNGIHSNDIDANAWLTIGDGMEWCPLQSKGYAGPRVSAWPRRWSPPRPSGGASSPWPEGSPARRAVHLASAPGLALRKPVQQRTGPFALPATPFLMAPPASDRSTRLPNRLADPRQAGP